MLVTAATDATHVILPAFALRSVMGGADKCSFETYGITDMELLHYVVAQSVARQVSRTRMSVYCLFELPLRTCNLQ